MLGENGGLIVIIRSYQPRVSCTAPRGQPTDIAPGACREILTSLPVSHQRQVFGTPPQQDLQVALPKYFTAGESFFLQLSLSKGHSSNSAPSSYVVATSAIFPLEDLILPSGCSLKLNLRRFVRS